MNGRIWNKRIAAGCLILMTTVWSLAKGQQIRPTLWDPHTPVPEVTEIPLLKNVEFHVIKKREKEVDQYNWLHGVALAWHKGKLYVSFGHNKGDENTAGEQARGRVSDDGGRTWSDLFTIDSGEKKLAVSHGVFLSSNEGLWAFHGSFYGRMQKVHMRAYVLDEATGKWKKTGAVAEQGFWPMDEPTRMANGNWIIGGISVGGANHAAVTISHGDNLLKWDVIVIPRAKGIGRTWGESTVIVNGKSITNISRYGSKALALVAHSEDYGRTWTEQRESNLPMTASKPYCGILSTGQRYLICSTASNIRRRHPLTIAVGRPGDPFFSRIYRIRKDVFPNGPGESARGAALSYPYAVEYRGKLYVAYSNDGGRGKNRNSAELAIIPISELQEPNVQN